MTSRFIYYVYAYLRSKDSATAKAGTPYYIGKGSFKRAWKSHGSLRLPPDKNNIVILVDNLSNIGALAIERRYIRWYGRKDLNSGILLNKTNGGEGADGAKHSDTHRKNNSLARIGVKRTPHTEETKQKISNAHAGRKFSKEVCENMSRSRTGKKLSESHKQNIVKSMLNNGNCKRTVKSIETGKIFNIPVDQDIPYMHLGSVKGYKLYGDGVFITPNIDVLHKHFAPSKPIGWFKSVLGDQYPVKYRELREKILIIDTRKYSFEELMEMVKPYKWIST